MDGVEEGVEGGAKDGVEDGGHGGYELKGPGIDGMAEKVRLVLSL